MTVWPDRYTLVAPVGRGSMGTVYEAYDNHLDRRVALKRIEESMVDPTSMRRFRREARLTARIGHPGVPAVYDLADDLLAMEYVQGSTLRDLVAEAAPLPVSWVAAIGLQIAAVLACAHRVSLIHRDLKPSNILLTRAGGIKVIDFGVAALSADAALSTLTPAGVVVGTATYQAPERLLGLYSVRSDLYSLGRVLHDLAPDSPLSPLLDELTAANPDDRPASALVAIRRLLPSLQATPALHGFVDRDVDVPATTRAYLALVNTSSSVAPSPVPADLRRVRSHVDRLIAADQIGQAATALSAAIAADPDGPQSLDLRHDLARLLFDSGDFAQASTALAVLVPDLVTQLGSDHVAVLRARLQHAQAVAQSGCAAEALALYEATLPDLARTYGDHSRDVFDTRRSIAVLLAVTGEHPKALLQLAVLVQEQERALGPADPQVVATKQLVDITGALSVGTNPNRFNNRQDTHIGFPDPAAAAS